MNTILKIFLSMSFSGSLLILALLFGKQFLKNKISRQWQYYIWMVVVLRLLLPFGTEVSLMGKAYQTVDQALADEADSEERKLAFSIMKHRNYKGRELLPLAVNDVTRAGDADAVEQVLRYYEGYINKICTRTTMKAAVPTPAWTST